MTSTAVTEVKMKPSLPTNRDPVVRHEAELTTNADGYESDGRAVYSKYKQNMNMNSENSQWYESKMSTGTGPGPGTVFFYFIRPER